jgi:hypothetical protein
MPNNNMSKPPNKQQIHAFRETQVLCINTRKWHKVTLSVQVQAMVTKNQCPTLTPKPLSFLGLDGEDYLDHLSLVTVKPCLFFHRFFELTWDVKFVFCQNSYHSWCALNHFPTSTKCLLEGVWARNASSLAVAFKREETMCWWRSDARKILNHISS